MSNPAFSQFLRRWARSGARPKAAPAARPAKLRVEEVEARVVPAAVPLPLVGTAQAIPGATGTYAQPSAAVDPTDPDNLVMVANNGTIMTAFVSTDGGERWTAFFDNAATPAPNRTSVSRHQDPGIDPLGRTRAQTALTNTIGASAAFSRDGTIYIAAVEQNAATGAVATSGALVLYAFDFNGGRPAIIDLDPDNLNDGAFGFFGGGWADSRANVLYRWYNAAGTERDGAFNPTVAVNNNLPTFTDPESGRTVVDTMAGKAVYVAWNTITSQSGFDPNVPGSGFNAGRAGPVQSPAAILVAGSSDGGLNFSTPVLANSGAYFAANTSGVMPQVSFTPATLNPAVNPNTATFNFAGQLTFTWQTLGGRDANGIPFTGDLVSDTSRPDDDPDTAANVGDPNRAGVTAARDRQYVNETILDALPNPGGGTSDIPVTTNIDFSVNLMTAGNMGPNDSVTDLNFGLAILAADPSTFRVRLTSPDPDDDPATNGPGERPVTITLFANWTAPDGSTPPAGTPPFGVLAGNNYGVGLRTFSQPPNLRTNVIGTVFDDQAPRFINDRANVDPFAYNVQTDSVFGGLLRSFYRYVDNAGVVRNLTAEQLSGTWTLSVTDNRSNGQNPPPQQVVFVEVHASGNISNTGFGADRFAAGSSTVPVNPDGSGQDRPAISPVVGLGGGVSLAYDNTLGTFTQFGGRLYAAYTVPTYDNSNPPVLVESDVFVQYSDNAGASWSFPVQVNDDSIADNFTQGNRWQFQPTIAVDSSTGTVVVTWFDARNDASNGRAATYIATSNDGGDTFSTRTETGGYNNQVPSNQTFLNNPKLAIDAVTGRTVVMEPIPSNFTTFNVDADGNFRAPNGPGLRQSLIAVDGRVLPFWAGNNNATGTQIFIGRQGIYENADLVATAPAQITAGPRIVTGDQGPVINTADAGGVVGPYNNVFAADGTRLLTGFVVEFDRPVAVDSFTTADVEVRFRGPATPLSAAATQLPLARVIPLDPRVIGGFTAFPLASKFYVEFLTPQGAIGTYSYSVGPDIRDRNRTVESDRAGTVVGPIDLGNEMDQDADGARAETNGSAAQPDDRFAIPRPATGGPFTLPYAADSLPIIVPGPYVAATEAERPAGQPDTDDNLVLNAGTNALIVTFDRDIVPSSFTRRNIRRLTGPVGVIAGADPADPTSVFTVAPVAVNPNTGGARSFRITFPRQVLSGGYTFELGPNPTDNNPATNTIRAVDQPRVVTELAAGANEVVVTFDRPITRAVTAADVLRVTGPNGPVPGPFTITRVSDTQFRVTLPVNPARPAGQYVIEFNDDPAQTGNEPLRVPAAGTATTAANRNPLPLLDTDHDAGLEQLRGGVPEPGTGEILSTRTYSTPAQANVTIPANGSVDLPLNIPDDFLVRQDTTNANLTLRASIRLILNAQFPNVPDLTGELIAPDGTSILLFAGPGTQGQPNQTGFAGTVFDDRATTSITAARPPFSPAAGAFNPQEPFGRLVERPEGPVSAKGTWRVRITNAGTRTGVLQNFTLTLPFVVSGTGLGEEVADRTTVGFRIFTQDPSNPLSRQQWTPVGPASQNTHENPGGLNTGRVTALAVDPSDPSGNTVYAGGASGGIWKTANFLTTDARGPDWMPLTDLAPSFGLNIGSIAVFGRNNDTNQSVIIAATGEGDSLGQVRQAGGRTVVASPGIGFLLSEDGGKSWRVLDSTRNVDAGGNFLPLTSSQRDGRFRGTVGFKVVFDPTPTGPTGNNLIIYAALSDNPETVDSATTPNVAELAGGVYRSNDTGRTWTLVRAGQATDLALAAASAPSFFNPTNPNLSRNLQIMYASFRADTRYLAGVPGEPNRGGVYFTDQAPDAAAAGGPGAMVAIDGRLQNPLFRDDNFAPSRQIPIGTFPGAADRSPGGVKGRITLAVPALSTDVVRNIAYQGWVYALVAGAGTNASGGPIDGLYMSKDFGRNWTRVRLNGYRPPNTVFTQYGTNDVSAPEYNPFGLDASANSEGNFTQSLAVDPLDPNIVYLGGANEATRAPLGGFLRVDVTRLEDAQNITAYNNSLPNTLPVGVQAGGPRLQFGQPNNPGDLSRFTGSAVVGPYQHPVYAGPGGLYGQVLPDDLRNRAPGVSTRDPLRVLGYLNVFRNPADPFTSNATLFFRNIDSSAGAGFQNRGFGATIQHIDAENETNVHEILTIIDPVTGKTRLITGDDQGVASAVASDDGSTDDASVGFAVAPNKRRNGDLQIGQLYYGASQPSQLAADIDGVRRLFYATSDNNGYPRSTNSVLQDGNNRGSTFTDLPTTYTAGEPSVGYSGTGVAVDQTGTVTAYEFRWPGSGGQGTDFFRVIPPNTYQERDGGQNNGLNDGFSRTNGLLQDLTAIGGVADDPLGGNTGVSQGQWLPDAGSNFAVNLINPNGIVISANGTNLGAGRVFRTTTQGVNWFVIGETPQVAGAFAPPGQTGPSLDGTYAAATTFGAPVVGATQTELDNFIYVGTNGGRVFVTRTGRAPWLNITAGVDAQTGALIDGLDGSPVQQIVANPRRGSTDAFAVTLRGVYYKANAFDTNTGWVNVTGNLFGLQKPSLPTPGNLTDNTPTLKYLTTIAADWRFATPVNPNDPQSPTFPVLYVGGEGGVFRSTNALTGATWNYFPAASTYTEVESGQTFAIPAGGFLPNVHVTDLDLVLGDIDPANGLPKQAETGGLNLLLATTFGRGQFAIRLDPELPPNSIVSGPRVVQLINPNPVNGPSSSFRVVFSGPVDPRTFTPADVRITGPGGAAIPVLSVTPVDSSTLPTTFDIAFQQVDAARTSVDVLIGANPDGSNRPLITDLGGFAMNQDADLVNGEPVVDQFRTTIVLNAPTNNRLVVVSAPPTAVAGVPVTVTVEARDANDLPLTGLNGRLDLSAGSPATGPFSPTQVQFVNGRATFEIVFERTGPQTVRVALGGSGTAANPTAFTVNVSAAPTGRFDVVPPTTVLTIGVNSSDVAFTVTARDQFGNRTTFAGPASVALAGAGGQVPGTVQFADGVATFTGRFTAQGTTTVTVSAPDPTNPANTVSGEATVAVNSGTASAIVVTPQGSGPFIVNQPVTVVVRAVDAAGNTAAFNGPFAVSVGDPDATISPTSPSFVNGTATIQVTFQTPGTYTVNVNAGALTGASGPLAVLGTPPRPPVVNGITAVGTDTGGTPVVQVFNPDGTGRTQILPFGPGFNNEVDPGSLGFTGGNRVAVGDVTGDGVPDYVVGTGPSITAFVQVVNGATNQAVQNIQPFEDFKGGVFVAVGDVTGDGVADIVVTPDLSGGPRVSVFRGGDFRRVANFFGINDPNFRGGARAGVGDMNNDGFDEVVVSAGFGGGPRISVYDGAALAQGRQVNPVGDFFLFEPELRNGAYVAVGDVNGDGFADLIGGAGPGGGPRVLVVSGKTLLTEGVEAALAPEAAVANFFAGDTENRGGIRVAVKDLDGDRFKEIVTGSGEGGGSRVTAYDGESLVTGEPTTVFEFDALDGYSGGVFVG